MGFLSDDQRFQKDAFENDVADFCMVSIRSLFGERWATSKAAESVYLCMIYKAWAPFQDALSNFSFHTYGSLGASSLSSFDCQGSPQGNLNPREQPLASFWHFGMCRFFDLSWSRWHESEAEVDFQKVQ